MAAPTGGSYYKCCRILILLLCTLGIILSVYAYYVEISKEKNPSFKAFCDISSSISCSKVFTSRYGRGFGLFEYVVGKSHWINQPNSIFGIIFYILQITLTFSNSLGLASLQVFLAILANFGSVYLGYILYVILEDFCIICVSTYFVNFFLLIAAAVRRSQLSSALKRRSPKKEN